ncbi:MAG: ADP-ribosylglycohydrolase family protein [Roseivirga sp.]
MPFWKKKKTSDPKNPGRDMLLGVGDALGVPVEFKSRTELAVFPVTGMTGYSSHNQPPGTWSDDSSLTFCLAEELTKGYDLYAIGQSFRKWYYQGHWTAHGTAFDIGNSTYDALERLSIKDMAPDLAGGFSEFDNGNGSLMRILPLAFYTINLPVEERFARAKEVSSITHAHFRSVMSCFLYLEFAQELMKGANPREAHRALIKTAAEFFKNKDYDHKELGRFDRVLDSQFTKVSKGSIRGSGYVLHSLEASIWCLLNTSDYESAVLQAVNLGEDTDTSGAITGGLAGLFYGYESIPKDWLNTLARAEDISALADRLSQKYAQIEAG